MAMRALVRAAAAHRHSSERLHQAALFNPAMARHDVEQALRQEERRTMAHEGRVKTAPVKTAPHTYWSGQPTLSGRLSEAELKGIYIDGGLRRSRKLKEGSTSRLLLPMQPKPPSTPSPARRMNALPTRPMTTMQPRPRHVKQTAILGGGTLRGADHQGAMASVAHWTDTNTMMSSFDAGSAVSAAVQMMPMPRFFGSGPVISNDRVLQQRSRLW